ncbi:DNA alkylation repair protein [Pararhodobacter sp. CCB-MM2]|uniref:DNA alkylation repair protein n=1 Tax=Pararhodobacter sp. CCB-MM2 TaxID=1786003 RepID=UPI0008360005|nr:DNA alkylation repair protein [Pararhodobacter sp. CCB-MM2]
MTEPSTDTATENALAQLAALADPARAEEMRAYHKIDRPYLGLANPQVDDLVAAWRAEASVEERVALASGLWASDIHEAMVAAAKLLTQARLRPDEAAWALIASWAEGFNGWAVSDHASSAGGRRLVADPSRLDRLERWIAHENMWTRRASLVMTLPWARMANPKEADLAVRERVLGWCEGFVADRDWFMQKAVAWWVRDLSKHDPERSRAWIDAHGAGLKSFARKEAARHLG